MGLGLNACVRCLLSFHTINKTKYMERFYLINLSMFFYFLFIVQKQHFRANTLIHEMETDKNVEITSEYGLDMK